jgi:hypothetical protein
LCGSGRLRSNTVGSVLRIVMPVRANAVLAAIGVNQCELLGSGDSLGVVFPRMDASLMIFTKFRKCRPSFSVTIGDTDMFTFR